jgi:ABC-type multidrug transport system fused ATPase/permease subunit
MESFKTTWKVLEGYRRRVIVLVCLYGISGFLEGLFLLTLIPILNSGVSSEKSNPKWNEWLEAVGLNPDNLLIISFSAFILLGLLSAAIMLFSERGLMKFRGDLDEDFRKKISNALLNMRWTTYHSMQQGDISKGILMEPSHAAQGVWHFLLGLGALLTLFCFSIVALFISVKMTLITIVFVSFAAIGYQNVSRKALKHAKHWTSTGTSIGNQVSEIFGNLKFFRSTGSSLPAEVRTNAIYKQHSKNFFLSQIFDIIMKFAYQSGGIIFLGILLAISLLSYKFPLAEMIILLAVFYRMVPRLRAVQQQFYQARTFQAWYLSWKERYDFVLSHQEKNPGIIRPSFEKSIQVQNLSFSYPKNNMPVLQKIDLTVEKSQCVALVGESGSGKSTMIDLLTGLLSPSLGRILLDGTPLDELNIDQWRRKIGLVIQESPIFHTTVLENIAWGYEDPDPESAKRCAQLAHAWEFIETLPEGLNTVVGEKGGRFSVGQKQRIALARALYRDPSLLILDEATSALDGESEKIIQESLESLKGKFAIFMVAHRLKTVHMADKIIVLGEGKILEQGTWSELINKPSGTFRRMAQLQGLVKPSEKIETV